MLHGSPLYTLKVLIESLRMRGLALRGSRVALLGFAFDNAHPHAAEIHALLLSHGAEVALLDAPPARHTLDEDLAAALVGADAVLIPTEHPVFRAIRPKEFRAIGIQIVIPTSTRA